VGVIHHVMLAMAEGRNEPAILMPMTRHLVASLTVACVSLVGCGGGEPTSSPSALAATSSVTHDAAVPVAPTSAAVSLRAPSADVDQALTSGGRTDGVINPDRGDLIWFDGYDRVEPGQIGTAVVAAHVTYEGEPDVFSDLDDVAVGDPITVGYADGSETTFAVTDAEIIDKTEVQTDPRVWGDQDDARRLVLITCDDALGFRDDGHRNANLVVFASPVQPG